MISLTGYEQIAFWQDRLEDHGFVYFIQEGDDGPVKVGYAVDPLARLAELQTGNPDELRLRHVVPGSRADEASLHQRFRELRIRGEWFELRYGGLVLVFAEALSALQIERYDGHGSAPAFPLAGGRTEHELDVLRAEIERMWHRGLVRDEIADFLRIPLVELDEQLWAMRWSPLYEINARSHGRAVVQKRGKW